MKKCIITSDGTSIDCIFDSITDTSNLEIGIPFKCDQLFQLKSKLASCVWLNSLILRLEALEFNIDDKLSLKEDINYNTDNNYQGIRAACIQNYDFYRLEKEISCKNYNISNGFTFIKLDKIRIKYQKPIILLSLPKLESKCSDIKMPPNPRRPSCNCGGGKKKHRNISVRNRDMKRYDIHVEVRLHPDVKIRKDASTMGFVVNEKR